MLPPAFSRDVLPVDVVCPTCGAEPGSTCQDDGHRWDRFKAQREYLKANAVEVAYRDGLVAEVEAAAARSGLSTPEFMQGALEERLRLGR